MYSHIPDPLELKIAFFLDPDKAAERAQLNATVGNLLEKYGVKPKEQEQQKEEEKPKGCGRSDGKSIAELRAEERRSAMTKEKKEKIKGGAALSRTRSGRI